MTPEEKLCSRWWRIRNSAGMLWPILSLGLLGGVGLLVRGIKAKKLLWLWLGIGFLAVGLFVLISSGSMNAGSGTKANPTPTLMSTLWGWISFGGFAGSLTTMIITNRAWLKWKAHATDTKWYAETALVPATPSAQSMAHQALSGLGQTSARQQAVAAPPLQQPPAQSSVQPESAAIEVNGATSDQLQNALLLDPQMANAIVSARGSQGFASFEDLLGRVAIQPHLLLPLRNRMSFSAPSHIAPGTKPNNKHALHDL
jgi:DNA uptake protein ComE-like DNA-binding protein